MEFVVVDWTERCRGWSVSCSRCCITIMGVVVAVVKTGQVMVAIVKSMASGDGGE